MTFLRRTVLTVGRTLVPRGSRRRRLSQLTYRTLVGALAANRRARVEVDKPSKRRPGVRSYRAWRRQQVQAVLPIDADATFLVIIENQRGGHRAEARTRKSVAAQKGMRSEIVAAPTGAQIDELCAQSDATFVLFLKAGCELRAGAFREIAHEHRRDPEYRVIGFDSDERTWWGARRRPRFRPSFSPEMLLGANYLGRALAISRTLAADVPSELSDRGLWKLLLLANLEPRQVGRLPRVLLTEPYRNYDTASDADAAMVTEVLATRGETATASVENGVLRVRFVPQRWPSVSIVIPTRHSRGNLSTLLPSLASTTYEATFDVQIIDNGGESEENAAWYVDNTYGLNLSVMWWTETPFNYSRVNNVAVRATTGDVVVMLNDDTQIVDPSWLSEIVGHVMRPGVGTVGLQLRNSEGLIQHGGVLLGPGGFADNLFAGLRPHSATLLGPTDWYRNTLAVTGACVAMTRNHFEEVAGLDERFQLCGSDVVLGLDQVVRGRRNVVIPFDTVRHFESVTRGSSVPAEDFYASFWRYHAWIQNGDPFMSPNVSRLTAIPRLASRLDRSPIRFAFDMIGRTYAKVAQSSSISEEARGLAHFGSASRDEVRGVHETHAAYAGPLEIKSINWFIPDIDMPFFGGLNTAFRLAATLARQHGVKNRFVVLSAPNEAYVSSALAAAFPELAEAEVTFYDGHDDSIAKVPSADAAVATLWLTAVHVAKTPDVKRRFYLMQDYEPAFYPASSMFAMTEETYRLGLYGICNTPTMGHIYSEMYGGKARSFVPAVDRSIYHAQGRRVKGDDEPVTIFAYARDHFRNCWELVDAALLEIKRRYGTKVRIVAAGARHLPAASDYVDLGLLDYRETGMLYRETDIGLTMQISRHPSYLPLELMACGVPMVAPDSNDFMWIFEQDVNALLAMRSADDIVEQLATLIENPRLRAELSRGALDTIDARHSSWDAAFDGIYAYMCDPESPQ